MTNPRTMRVVSDRLDHSEQVGVALSQNRPVTAATAATVTLYSADGLIAVQEKHDDLADIPQVVNNSVGDDDLTSLTWLQDKNLLKSVSELPKQEFRVESVGNTLSNSASSSSSSKSPNRDNNAPRISYDPLVHVNSKPPFSFSCLIFMAIEDSDDKALPVKDIYIWILNHFPYYRNAPIGWKNSVRHNLSLNKCFKKVDKSPNLGKGSLWMVEQRFKPCLNQALQKTRYHQYHKFVHTTCSKSSSNEGRSSSNHCNALKVGKMTSDDGDTCDSKSFLEAESITDSKCSTTTASILQSTVSLRDSLADIDAAATAMLVLKHGACAFDIKAENVDFFLSENSKVPIVIEEFSEDNLGLPNCPCDDHIYGYHHLESADRRAEIDDRLNSTYWNSDKGDMEERRKIVEGADALLNLAGITTSNTRKRSLSIDEQYSNVKQSSVEATNDKPRIKNSRKEKACNVVNKASIKVKYSNDESTQCNEIEKDNDPCKNISSNATVINRKEKVKRNVTLLASNRNRLRKKVEKKRFKL